MLNVKVKLQAIEDTIDRIITRQILESIKTKVLGIGREINYYYSENDRIHKKKDQARELKPFNGLHHEFIAVETNEVPFQDHNKLILNTYPDQYSFYKDPDIDSKFTTVVQNMKLSFSIRYCTKSKGDAAAILAMLRSNPSMDGYHFYHQLEYSYVVPQFLVNLLAEINRLKNIRYPDDKKLSLLDYVKNTFDNRLDFLNPMTGNPNNVSLVIREAQVEVNGVIETDLYELRLENEFSDTGYYVIPLEYYVVYEKPSFLIATYPMLIFNTPISKQYLSVIPKEIPSDQAINTQSTKDLHALIDVNVDFINKFHYFNLGKNYVTVPFEDKAYSSIWINGYIPIFSVMNIIDVNNPTFLMNLNLDLGQIRLKQSLINFIMKSEREYITMIRRSFLAIKLFVGNEPKLTTIPLEIKENGDIVSLKPLDIKKTYRTCLYFISNLDMLYPVDKYRINTYIKGNGGIPYEDDFYQMVNATIDVVDDNTRPNPAGVILKNKDRLKGYMHGRRQMLPPLTVCYYTLNVIAKLKQG